MGDGGLVQPHCVLSIKKISIIRKHLIYTSKQVKQLSKSEWTELVQIWCFQTMLFFLMLSTRSKFYVHGLGVLDCPILHYQEREWEKTRKRDRGLKSICVKHIFCFSNYLSYYISNWRHKMKTMCWSCQLKIISDCLSGSF